MAQHQAKIEEAVEQAKALRKAMKTGKMAAQEIMAANNLGSAMIALRSSRANIRNTSRASIQVRLKM